MLMINIISNNFGLEDIHLLILWMFVRTEVDDGVLWFQRVLT
jgi:hypothetical protein